MHLLEEFGKKKKKALDGRVKEINLKSFSKPRVFHL
jgi:hypothetical protein